MKNRFDGLERYMKIKESGRNKENMNFKYSDHLINSPLNMLGLFAGENIISGIGVRKINTITSCIYPERAKKMTKKKNPYAHWTDPVHIGVHEGDINIDNEDIIADVDFDQDAIVDNETQPLPTLQHALQDELYNYYIKPEPVISKKPVKLFFMERLEQHLIYTRMSLMGKSPALIKGYIINGIVCLSDKEVEDLVDKYGKEIIDPKSVKTIIKVYTIKEDKIVSKYKIHDDYRTPEITKSNLYYNILPLFVKLRIKGCENSNSFFYTEDSKARESLVKKDVWNLLWKLDSVTVVRNKTKLTTDVIIVEDPETKEEVKFVYTDCLFINPSGRGYNIPIDRTITTRSIVKLKIEKLSRYGFKKEDDTTAEIVRIKPDPSSKRLFLNSRTRRRDVVKIKLISNGRMANVYAEDLKFIENKKQVYDNNVKKEAKKASNSYTAFFQTQGQTQEEWLATHF